MNTKLLLLAVAVAAFSSCTTLYKSGQTPDDVYYSPVRLAGEGYVDQKKEQQTYQSNTYSNEERAIRLGINDYRWRYLDNNYNYSNSLYINDYSYSPYSYGYNYGYYYNPYYWPYPVYGTGYIGHSTPKNTTPRVANLGSYNNPVYNNSRIYTTHGMGASRPTRTYNNNNKGSAVGNVIRQVFTPTNTTSSNRSDNNINNNSSNNNRTYTPSTNSGSSSSGSSSSGSGSVSRPPRN